MNNRKLLILPFAMACVVGISVFFIFNAFTAKSDTKSNNLNSSIKKNVITKTEDKNGEEKSNSAGGTTQASVVYGGETDNKADNSNEDISASNNNDKVESDNDNKKVDSKEDTDEAMVKSNSELTTSNNDSNVTKTSANDYVFILSVPTTLKVGDKVNLSIDSSSNQEVQYTSENPSVATVDSNGVISAERMGTTMITVSLNDKNDSVVINVIEPTVSDVSSPVVEETNEEEKEENNVENISKEKKNGWVTRNGKKYYYRNGVAVTGWKNIAGARYYFNDNGVMQRNTYVDYHYLRPNGKMKKKIGQFSVTIYGAIAWPNQNLSVRNSASQNGSIVGEITAGKKVKILSDVNGSTGYIKVRRGNVVGYVVANNLMINLPDVIPDMYYSITNANKSKFKAADTNISGVTGNNLYGFERKYNAKIGKTTYYAPMLYPVAVQLNSAHKIAKKQGYNFKVYDTYRPYDVSMMVANNLRSLYNSNSKVRGKVDYDLEGNYWGQGWFIAQGVSGHNRGTDIDLALTDSNGRELKAQSPMHTLDTSSLVKYNNDVSNKLRSIMTSVGFETLKSEWWHFQEDNYRTSPYVSFKLK